MPLAQILGKQAVEREELSEQNENESFAKFQARLHKYLKDWIESNDPVLIVCGHGDTLPLMVFHLLGTAVDFKKAGFLELAWEAGQAHLKQYIPTLKVFYD